MIPQTDKRGDELLLFIADFIVEHPEHFYMGWWMNTCKTEGCMAGELPSQDYLTPGIAVRLCGLENDSLFYAEDWPEKFIDAFCDAPTPLARAQVAAERIRHFVKMRE